MIYTSDDYVVKYQDVLAYLIGRAVEEQFSYSFIQESISYSKAFSQFEMSNVTEIAFSSMQKLYFDIFPSYISKEYEYNPYNIYGWLGYVYIQLFLKLKITFEMLFILLPIEECLSMYNIYHEMDISHVFSYLKEKNKYSNLDLVMTYRRTSSKSLSKETGISFSTIQAFRYNKRDINKFEANKVIKISRALNVKMETLVTDIHLTFDNK